MTDPDPKSPRHPDTAVLSDGYDPQLSVGAVRPPVFRSSTYVFHSPESAERAFAVALGRAEATDGESLDVIYSRLSHPNAEILEAHLVPLEPGARSAVVFNSGMAAISTVALALCRPGMALIHTVPVYGGTHHLMSQIIEPLGIHCIPVPAGNTAALQDAIRTTPNLRLVLIETPANPTLRMTDIRAAVQEAGKLETPPIVAVDNTFLGPVFQHPIQIGVDVTIYSATKYLAGFSDMLGGVVLGKDTDLISSLRGVRALLGNILQPDECWLLDSRLATVSMRMNRQSKNAERIVDALKDDPRIERFHYPTLFVDPEQRRIYESQCDFPGGLFAIELKGGKAAAFDLLRNLRIIKNAVSLGAMESLACHPASTTHSEMSREELVEAGVTDGLVRVSVGIEDWRDLLADLKQALDSIS